MACLSCKKSKTIQMSNDKIKVVKASTLYTNQDFVIGHWQGDDNEQFIGSQTRLNYGIKQYGQRLLVHKNDATDERVEIIEE